jgi:branched-chain amino acid transport system substrate-binding protein
LKRIIFLIVATLLVLGIVLPGCGGEGEGEGDLRPAITIGVAGPMGMAQGKHHMYGAEMARDELNGSNFTTDGVSVNGTLHKITLVSIDTNEVLDPTGADGVTEMNKKIGSVDYVVGGFRTEAVLAYRGIVMSAHKIFLNCGAATEELQHSVVDNYATYKYWFKATPPNELFLSQNTGKMFGMLLFMVKYNGVYNNATWSPKVAIIAENAAWTTLSWRLGQLKYGAKGYLCGRNGTAGPGVWLVNTVATVGEVDAILDDINLATPKPNMIMTIMSGPVGVTYANRVGAKLPNVMTFGINVEAQRAGFTGVAAYAKNMIFQDSWAPGVQFSAKTSAFYSAFVAKTGEKPIYTAATYDAVLGLAECIEAVNSLSSDTIVPQYETMTRVTTSAKLTGLYPKWDGATNGTHPFYGYPGLSYPLSTQALNSTQVLALYPWLNSAKYSYDGLTISNWTYNSSKWTMLPHTTHDLIYGSEWITGSFSQWQNVSGTLEKVSIWPKAWYPGLPTNLTAWLAILPGVNASTLYSLGPDVLSLWDQYGWWNMEYPGTGTVYLTDWIGWLIATGALNGTLY